MYIGLAEAKRIQATKGAERALAALKEALGLDPECCLALPSDRLPDPLAQPCRHDILVWALARRGDLIQANTFVDITCLEVDVQATTLHNRKETFAIGGDIHARQVAPVVRNNEYRPGAVAPEMPAMLVGTRCDRMEHARALNARAHAVAEKARNLIALEAEDAYLRWEQASQQAAATKKAAAVGEKMANNLREDFTGGAKVKIEDVMNAHVQAAQAHAQYNEYLFQEIVALADLERITAGAFCACWTGVPHASAAPPK
jgi:outer membrane protein TolC